MPDVRGAHRDLLAGAIFVVLGLGFGLGALAYDLGSPLQMGPGYVPLLYGGLLVALGVAVMIKGLIAGEREPIGDIDWRALVLITAALIFFGVTIRGLGLIGALFGTSLLAVLGRSATSIREALVIAVGVTILSIVIFVVGLQLRLPLIGTWIPL